MPQIRQSLHIGAAKSSLSHVNIQQRQILTPPATQTTQQQTKLESQKSPPSILAASEVQAGVQKHRGITNPVFQMKRGRNNRNASSRSKAGTDVVVGNDNKQRSNNSESNIYEFHEDSGAKDNKASEIESAGDDKSEESVCSDDSEATQSASESGETRVVEQLKSGQVIAIEDKPKRPVVESTTKIKGKLSSLFNLLQNQCE